MYLKKYKPIDLKLGKVRLADGVLKSVHLLKDEDVDKNWDLLKNSFVKVEEEPAPTAAPSIKKQT